MLLEGALSDMRQFLETEMAKNDEKCFLFHLKSSFRFQDIVVYEIVGNVYEMSMK